MKGTQGKKKEWRYVTERACTHAKKRIEISKGKSMRKADSEKVKDIPVSALPFGGTPSCL